MLILMGRIDTNKPYMLQFFQFFQIAGAAIENRLHAPAYRSHRSKSSTHKGLGGVGVIVSGGTLLSGGCDGMACIHSMPPRLRRYPNHPDKKKGRANRKQQARNQPAPRARAKVTSQFGPRMVSYQTLPSVRGHRRRRLLSRLLPTEAKKSHG